MTASVSGLNCCEPGTRWRISSTIHATRRNVGALKLSNLLQPDRFEEDLGISRLRVRPPARSPVPKPSPPASEVPDAAELERRRLRGLAWTVELRRSLD
jgi:hypothetical protein